MKKMAYIILTSVILLVVWNSFFVMNSGAAESDNLTENETSLPEEELMFKNPFISLLPKPQPKVKGETSQPSISHTPLISAPALKVSGLVWNTDKPQAIVNSQIVNVGDTVSESEIVSIEKTGIKILYKGEAFTIPIEE